MTRSLYRYAAGVLLGATALSGPAGAHTLYDHGDTLIDFDFEAAAGIFNSSEAYAQVLRAEEASPTWLEGYAKYGLSAAQNLAGAGTLYGAFNLLSSATRGDGDAGGFTTGKEEDTQVEDAYIGWRSGDLVPWLGEDGIDLSFGSQNFTIGDGFLVNGDSLNFGEGFEPLAEAGIAPNGLSRGGAYWLAARKAFDQTAILRLGGQTGVHLDAFWLDSDNKAQAEMELAGVNAELCGDLTEQWFADLETVLRDWLDKAVAEGRLKLGGLRSAALARLLIDAVEGIKSRGADKGHHADPEAMTAEMALLAQMAARAYGARA